MAGAAATVFGFGWVVVAVAGAILFGIVAGWPRLGPGWALLPVGALVLPSVAFALGGLRLDPSLADSTVSPARAADLPPRLQSGLGLLTVDLRHTALPASGVIPLRLDAGVRRTLVALPHDRCVHVDVRQHQLSAAARLLRGYETQASMPGATVFGRGEYGSRVTDRGRRDGPTLRIDFRSDGGELVVRDYPDRVEPAYRPDWPGYPVYLAPRPDLHGLGEKAARKRLQSWKHLRRAQERSKAKFKRLMAGPVRAMSTAVTTTELPTAHDRRRGARTSLADATGRLTLAAGALLLGGLAAALSDSQRRRSRWRWPAPAPCSR